MRNFLSKFCETWCWFIFSSAVYSFIYHTTNILEKLLDGGIQQSYVDHILITIITFYILKPIYKKIYKIL